MAASASGPCCSRGARRAETRLQNLLRISDDTLRQGVAKASAGGCKADREQPRSGEAAVDVWKVPLEGKG